MNWFTGECADSPVLYEGQLQRGSGMRPPEGWTPGMRVGGANEVEPPTPMDVSIMGEGCQHLLTGPEFRAMEVPKPSDPVVGRVGPDQGVPDTERYNPLGVWV